MASAAASGTITSEPEFLTERRRLAAERARTLELPQFKGRPGWEFTDLSGLELPELHVGSWEHWRSQIQTGGGVESNLMFDLKGGIHGYSNLPDRAPPPGVIYGPLTWAASAHPELVERYLGSVLNDEADLFQARNDAGWEGGMLVYVPRGVKVERPIHNVWIDSGGERHARTLVVLEEGAQAEVWEQSSSSNGAAGVFNSAVELVLGDGAHLRYVNGQNLSESSWVFSSQRAEVGRDAALDWVALGFGSARGHVRMETRLVGEGAEARVTGAYASHARQHIDFDTTQEHAAPNTTSDLAFRGVLTGRSTAVWKGNIIVDPGAQKTDAFQESRNLLLSKRAHADAIPGLEIQANDVRCTHAAAVAQVDPEQLFYLRSRGLRLDVAKRLVIEGFLAALVERFEEGPVRERLSEALEQRLALVLGDS